MFALRSGINSLRGSVICYQLIPPQYVERLQRAFALRPQTTVILLCFLFFVSLRSLDYLIPAGTCQDRCSHTCTIICIDIGRNEAMRESVAAGRGAMRENWAGVGRCREHVSAITDTDPPPAQGRCPRTRARPPMPPQHTHFVPVSSSSASSSE